MTSLPNLSLSRFLPASLQRLSIKLPAFVLLSVALCGMLVGYGAFLSARTALVDDVKDTISTLAKYRSMVLRTAGQNLATDIDLLAANPAVRDALKALSTGFGGAGVPAVQSAYVDKNPKPVDKRAEYDGTDDASAYGAAHRSWHPVLRKISKDRGYYDLFLITAKGDVVYTVEKEPDFATNLRSGQWKSTGLARAFDEAFGGGRSGAISFQDYEPYAPSNGDPAAFIAQVVRDDMGVPVGVVAIQLPTAVISNLVATKVLETGNSYVLGDGNRLRSFIAGRSDIPVLKALPDSEATREAHAGRFGVSEAAAVSGRPGYLAANPVEFLGKKWVMVVEVETSEITGHANAVGRQVLMIALGMVLVSAVLILFFARSIYRPILSMRDAVARIATGEAAAIPGEQRRDELGELARSLRQVHDAGVAAARIRSALDNAGTNVMVADERGNVIYSNRAMVRFFAENATEFRKQFPNFSPDQMLGAYMDSFHKNPEEIQRRVASLREPFRARIKIGELTLELVICPAFDAAGQRLGTLVEWNNLTDELKAMGEVTEVVEAATNGDFSGRVREEGKKGVVLHLAGGINRICNLVEGAMEEFTATMKRISEGDLTTKITSEHRGRFADMAAGINETIVQLSEMVATIQNTTRDITAAAREINAGASDLARRTEEEAASLEETAATTEELAASVKQTAESARLATDLSAKAQGVAAEGDTIVSDAVAAIERIERASSKISEIIGVIDDIAFQTNLLALNAAVEAARAGDAGKGFAVVASEVRTLAQRSGQAAKDIKALIVNSTEQVVEGVRLARATGQSLQNIVSASSQVAETVVMISSATAEQANGIEEMSTTVARIDEMTQQNSALAEESAASANELINQIDRLNRLVEVFRTEHQPGLSQRSTSEPDRLRQLAADAFVQSKVATPRPQPAAPAAARPVRAAQAGRGGRDDWAEF